MRACVRVCSTACIQLCAFMYMDINTCVCVCVYLCVPVGVCICECVRAWVSVYVQTHTCIHTYMNVSGLVRTKRELQTQKSNMTILNTGKTSVKEESL